LNEEVKNHGLTKLSLADRATPRKLQ